MGEIKELRDIEPFDRLSPELFEVFEKSALRKKFPPQVHIFNQHDPPTGYLYLIREGMVEITAQTPGDIEMVVDYRHEGQFFGGTPVFTGESYTGGARTARPTECYLIPEETLRRAGADNPQLRDYFTRIVISRVKNLYADIVAEHGRKALTQVEAFPFQKRLSEIMSSPVEVCEPHISVQDVARQMCEKGISSVLVLDGFGAPIGLITEKEIIAKVVAPEGADCRSLTAGDIMVDYPHVMSPDRYMYEAMSYMLAHRIKHLPVIDRDEPVGMVTMRDLMRFRSQKAMLLVGSIKEARSIDELAAIKMEAVKVADALLSETRSPFETMEILTYIHHCLLRRGYDIVLAEMEREGKTPPKIRSCLIIMGSGGRKEMLLDPDQDNGFIFEDYPDEQAEEVDAFFAPFCERLVDAFARIGYPLCNGKVMVNNPLWRGRLADWKKRVAGWIDEPEPQMVMFSTIFFDFRPLVGDASLSRELLEIVHGEIRRHPAFLYHLLENDLKYKPPLTMLGRFATEKSGEHKGQLSLKQAGSVFIVDCVRMFMLERGLDLPTTVERLDALTRLRVFNPETAEHLKAALASFIFLRLRNEIDLIKQGKKPSHYIDPYALSKNEQDLLKEAFRAAARLQDSSRRHFGQGIL